MMAVGPESRKMERDGKSKADVRVGQDSSAKVVDVTDAAPADSGALRWEAGSAFQVVEVAKKE